MARITPAFESFAVMLGGLWTSTLGHAETAIDSVTSSAVTFAGIEIPEDAVVGFLIYGFLFLMLVRKRFVG